MSPMNTVRSLMLLICLVLALACGKDNGSDSAANDGDGRSDERDAGSEESDGGGHSQAGGSRDAGSEAESSDGDGGSGDPEEAGGQGLDDESTITVAGVHDAASPVFLLAYDEQGVGVGLLAAKDASGNPVSVNGVTFYEREEVFRVEVDEQGRPTLVASREEALLLSDYSENSVRVSRVARDGSVSASRIEFDPEELEQVLAPPPRFDFVEKSADGELGQELNEFVNGITPATAVSCGLTLYAEASFWGQVSQAGGCLVGSSSDPGKRGRFERVLDGLSAILSLEGCILGAAELGTLLLVAAPTGPVGWVVALGAIGIGGVSCYSIAQTLDRFAEEEAAGFPDTTPPAWVQELSGVSPDNTVAAQLTATLHPARTVVQQGDSVLVTAVVDGGQGPYETGWATNDDLRREWDDLHSIEDVPQSRTWYEFAVQDCSRSYPMFDVAGVWVAVCGDGECSPEEDRVSCPAECDNEPAPVEDPVGTGLPARPGNPAVLMGDPHLSTFDALRYDMQAVGELTLLHDPADGLEVQIRTEPFTRFIPASVSIAVAARIGLDRVGVYRSGSVRLNGEEMNLELGRNELPDGGLLYRAGSTLTLVWADGSQLEIVDRGEFFDLLVDLATSRKAGTVEGLLGNFDGDASNELRSRGGELLDDVPTFEQFYRDFAESWRVTSETSLFDYEDEESTETFTDRTFPPGVATLSDLTDAEIAAAEAICRDAGVPEEWLESCVLDVGISGDPALATPFVDAPSPIAALEIQPPLAATGLSLADIVGGGDGSGNGSAQGINVLNGEVVTAHTSHVLCPMNVFALSSNPFVDGVFCPDGETGGTTAVTVSSTGLTMTGLPHWVATLNSSSSWDHLWNGQTLGVATRFAGSVLGAHANKGITFDLDAIERAHGNLPLSRFVSGAGFGLTPEVNPEERGIAFIVAVDGEEAARYDVLHEANLMIPIDVAIPEAARFLTLITSSDGDIASDHSFWLEPRLLVDGGPAVYHAALAAESMMTSEVDEQALLADGVPDGVFDVTVRGPIRSLVLYRVDALGQPLGEEQWDTVPAGTLPESTGAPLLDAENTRVLGVAEQGELLNTDAGFSISDDEIHILKLYAQDSGSFMPGNFFRLVAVSGGKAVFLSPVITY